MHPSLDTRSGDCPVNYVTHLTCAAVAALFLFGCGPAPTSRHSDDQRGDQRRSPMTIGEVRQSAVGRSSPESVVVMGKDGPRFEQLYLEPACGSSIVVGQSQEGQQLVSAMTIPRGPVCEDVLYRNRITLSQQPRQRLKLKSGRAGQPHGVIAPPRGFRVITPVDRPGVIPAIPIIPEVHKETAEFEYCGSRWAVEWWESRTGRKVLVRADAKMSTCTKPRHLSFAFA